MSPEELLAVPFEGRDSAWYGRVRALDPAARERVLEGADARRGDPAAFEEVHAVYRAVATLLHPSRPADLPRLRVVLDGNSGAHPDLEPLWTEVTKHGPPALAVDAWTRLASISSLRGEVVESDARYERALREAVALGGAGLVGVLAPWSSSLMGSGRDVEALVAAQEATARLDASASPWRRAWLAHTEAVAQLGFGELHAAREARERFAGYAVRGVPRQRRRAAPALARLDASLALARGDGETALAFLEEERRAWEACIEILPRQELALEALRVRATRTAGRPADAAAHGAAVLGRWPRGDARTLALRVETLRARLAADPTTSLGTEADEVRAALAVAGPSDTSAADRARLALDLAEAFAAAGRSADARVTYEVAAAASLARLAELDRFARTLPTWLPLAPAHAAALEAHRRRSADRHRALGAPLARLLAEAARAGDPVVRRLRNEHGLTAVCAWCQRVRLGDGRWLTVQQFLPLAAASDATLTHGICEDCRPALEHDLDRTLPAPHRP